MNPPIRALIVSVVALVAAAPAQAADLEPLLKRIQAVGREGANNAEAGKAWRELVQLGPEALFPTLAALDDADATAANWLRAAVDAIAERELAAGRSLPKDKLEAFVRETKHSGPGRRLAYEWLLRVDPAAADRLLPGMIQDPSVELRRDAVARVLGEAKDHFDKGDKETAMATYRKALAGARDRDQVDLIAKQLKTLGVEVDIAAHLGFIQKWQLLGPFDNVGGVGFQAVYPPEKGVDLSAAYAGKQGAELRWKEHATADPYGIVDLNKAIAKHMGATGYAFAAVVSPKEQKVQVRAATANALKIYLNGKEVFFREEYHHGMRFDQHVGHVTLRAGVNEILIKVCQNEQKDDWAQNWNFQLRICDAVGGGVPLTVASGKADVPAEGKVQR